MEQRDFIYWLQGFAELNKQAPTQEQWDSIREHLQLCFNKVTNSHILPTPNWISPSAPVKVYPSDDRPPAPAGFNPHDAIC